MLISSCAATLNNYVQKNVEHNLLRSIIMAALWNRAGYYIYALWFLLLSIFFFFLPILSRRRLDVYHTSTHRVALVRI